jgi:hypothetical protein
MIHSMLGLPRCGTEFSLRDSSEGGIETRCASSAGDGGHRPHTDANVTDSSDENGEAFTGNPAYSIPPYWSRQDVGEWATSFCTRGVGRFEVQMV